MLGNIAVQLSVVSVCRWLVPAVFCFGTRRIQVLRKVRGGNRSVAESKFSLLKQNASEFGAISLRLPWQQRFRVEDPSLL